MRDITKDIQPLKAFGRCSGEFMFNRSYSHIM
jgi:hypothetical protein